MQEKLISIIIPCYNQGKYLDEAIQSVLKSTYDHVEIIVINDGSTDLYTNKILNEKKWDKTTVYHIPNGGVANARNFGIINSHGEYILPLDADDKITNDFIRKAVTVLDLNLEVKIVSCHVELFGKRSGRSFLPNHSMEMLLAQNTMVVSSVFRRCDFEMTKGFNTNMWMGFEDWDFWLCILEKGGEVFRLNEVGFYYRISTKSRNNLISTLMKSQLRRTIFENHRELFSKYFFDPTKSFEYEFVIKSKEYRLGKFILSPIRILFNFFQNNFLSFI